MADRPHPLPRWLLAVYPHLARAVENPYYLAFRDRRIYHQIRIHNRLKDWKFELLLITGLSPGLVLMLMMDSVLALPFGDYLAGAVITMMSAVVLVIVYQAVRSKREQPRNHLAGSVGGVIGFLSVDEIQARDLWLAGATGRSLAEAVYAESWESLHPIAMRTALITFIAMPVALLKFTGWNWETANLIITAILPFWVMLTVTLYLWAGILAFALTDERRSTLLKYHNWKLYHTDGAIGVALGILILLLGGLMIYLSLSPIALMNDGLYRGNASQIRSAVYLLCIPFSVILTLGCAGYFISHRALLLTYRKADDYFYFFVVEGAGETTLPPGKDEGPSA